MGIPTTATTGKWQEPTDHTFAVGQVCSIYFTFIVCDILEYLSSVTQTLNIAKHAMLYTVRSLTYIGISS